MPQLGKGGLVQAQPGLAENPGLRERFLNWMRGQAPALQMTTERPGQVNTTAAILGEKAPLPPAQVAPPAAVNPYSVEYMIKEAQNNAPKYDQLGNRIR